MSKAPAFQLYAADFYVDTASWTIEEVGIYTRLLFYQWVNGSIPNDEKRLARIAGCSTKSFKKWWCQIELKFSVWEHDKLINTRLEETRQKQLNYSETKKKAAEKRWNKDDAHEDAHASHMQCPSSSSSSSNTKKKTYKVQSTFEIPDFINKETWQNYLDMRQRIRKPATEKAKSLIINQLRKIRDQNGHDPNAVLEQSIMNSWQAVYPLKEQTNGIVKFRQPYTKNIQARSRLDDEVDAAAAALNARLYAAKNKTNSQTGQDARGNNDAAHDL